MLFVASVVLFCFVLFCFVSFHVDSLPAEENGSQGESV